MNRQLLLSPGSGVPLKIISDRLSASYVSCLVLVSTTVRRNWLMVVVISHCSKGYEVIIYLLCVLVATI
jgi:hypothetical protein